MAPRRWSTLSSDDRARLTAIAHSLPRATPELLMALREHLAAPMATTDTDEEGERAA